MKRKMHHAIASVTRNAGHTPPLADLRDDQHVSERTIALVTGLSVSWVRKQRLIKQGPTWVKVGKAVRYPVRELREWLAALPRH
jgi:hypothetical protein